MLISIQKGTKSDKLVKSQHINNIMSCGGIGRHKSHILVEGVRL